MGISNVGRINVDIYGLSQASRLFYDNVRVFLINEVYLELWKYDTFLING